MISISNRLSMKDVLLCQMKMKMSYLISALMRLHNRKFEIQKMLDMAALRLLPSPLHCNCFYSVDEITTSFLPSTTGAQLPLKLLPLSTDDLGQWQVAALRSDLSFHLIGHQVVESPQQHRCDNVSERQSLG